jgi:hypothetical protein
MPKRNEEEWNDPFKFWPFLRIQLSFEILAFGIAFVEKLVRPFGQLVKTTF